MNKKLIAIAVAGAVAGPSIMSAASADVTVYGAMYPRLVIQDSNMDLIDGGSRVGFKSSKDMGNGNTVSGTIEMAVDITNATWGDGNRHGNVKYAGDWGSITIGQQWSISTDAQWHTCGLSGSSCAGWVGYQGRTADIISVRTGGIGALSLGAQAGFDGGDLADWVVTAGIDVGSVSFDANYRDDDTTTHTKVGASTTLAGVSLGLGFSDSASGADGFSALANFSGIKVQYDETGDDEDLTLNYDIDLGGSTLRLIIADHQPADTKFAMQWNYSL